MPREGKCGIYTKLKSFVPSPTWWERGRGEGAWFDAGFQKGRPMPNFSLLTLERVPVFRTLSPSPSPARGRGGPVFWLRFLVRGGLSRGT